MGRAGRGGTVSRGEVATVRKARVMSIEQNYSIRFIASLALREKLAGVEEFAKTLIPPRAY